MRESFSSNPPPVLDKERDVDTLPPLAPPQMPANYPAPAIIEGGVPALESPESSGDSVTETSKSLELVKSTYEEAFAAPIEAEKQQLASIEVEVGKLRNTSAQLESTLPETFAAGENKVMTELVSQLNDLDKRRISLLQEEIYVAGDVAFKKQEAQAYAAERNEIVGRLIEALTELLLKAKKELERLQNSTQFTKMQVEVGRAESQQSLAELSAFENQIMSFRNSFEGQQDYSEVFDEALAKIESARNKMNSQQSFEDAEFSDIDSSTKLLESKIGGYDGQLLQLEDLRDKPLLQLEDLRGENNGPAEADFTDAEFVDGGLEVNSDIGTGPETLPKEIQ